MYDDERIKIGREPITIVELYLDYCSLTYGEGDCSAAVGVTGDDRCYNTRATCKDVAAYVIPAGLPNAGGPRGLKTYRFSTPNAGLPADLGAIPSLRSVSFSPTKIDPGKSLGRRGECSVTFQDHPHHDVTIDKYVNNRAYDPMETGTFWAKFKERNPYYNGRIMRVYSGYLTKPFSWDNFQTRTYVIEKINGPSSKGAVTITGKDILKLADDERALCPRTTIARLSADLAAGGGNCTVLPAGAGANFVDGDYVRIDKELIRCDSVVGDVISFNVGDRGEFGTEDKTHKTDDAVQLCKYYYEEPVQDILYDLLVNYANIPATYIDTAQWASEATGWLSDFIFTGLIVEPTGITKLINELIENSTCYIFWNEIEEKIKLVAVKPPEAPLRLLTDDNAIIENTITITEKPDDRVSEIWFHYIVLNYTEKLDDATNFQRVDVFVDADAESPVQYNDYRIKKIYSRWASDDSELAVFTLLIRMLAAYRNTPRQIKFRIDAKDLDLWTGDLFRIRHRNIVDSSGAPRDTIMRIIEVAENKAGTWYEITAIDAEQEFIGRYCYIREDTSVDYATATAEMREYIGGWLCDDVTEEMPDGTGPYIFI